VGFHHILLPLPLVQVVTVLGKHPGAPRSLSKFADVVLEEWGLFWLQDNGKPLNRECKDFKCAEGAMDCCCHHILFNQLDFTCVKSHLEEVIMACGHLCNFYPKFHCELNYIEQYWGAVKLLYRSRSQLKKMDEMEKQVVACLNDIPLLQIQRYGFRNYI